jgi:hypothetical protein
MDIEIMKRAPGGHFRPRYCGRVSIDYKQGLQSIQVKFLAHIPTPRPERLSLRLQQLCRGH